MELTEMQVALLDDGDPLMIRAGVRQSPEAVTYFDRFVLEHDEVALFRVRVRVRVSFVLEHDEVPTKSTHPNS